VSPTPRESVKSSGMDTTLAALEFAAERARAYVAEVRERRVSPGPEALVALPSLHEPLPEHGSEPCDVLETLHAIGSPATVASTGGRYYGFVIGGSVPAAAGAAWLASAWDQNAALRVMSPIAAELEDVVLSWIAEALGLPAGCEGGLVTCATSANFTAMIAARHALLKRLGWDAERNGLFGAPRLRVVAGADVHASMRKAIRMAGFGEAKIEIVEADSEGRLRPEKLPALDANTVVCIQSGNVNSGSFDPAEEVCAKAKAAGSWVHVDGAFGLWAAVSHRYRHLLRGFEKADSWATDAHKWPNVNYDCGIVFVRDAQALRACMTMNAAYLQAGTKREPMYQTPDASRRARGVELWAALKSLGRRGLAELIERTCAHAQRFAEGLRKAGFAVLNEVVINQVLVSFGKDEMTAEVIRRVQEDGTCWCGGTEWRGRTAMRISVSSWATKAEDVERSLEAIIRIAREYCP
jgi:glutamate/tyrosine decarboxylase-like PLP-dependent enzyme